MKIMKKVAIMRKGDVHADQWMPYIIEKISSQYTQLLKATEKHAKNELSQNSLSGVVVSEQTYI